MSTPRHILVTVKRKPKPNPFFITKEQAEAAYAELAKLSSDNKTIYILDGNNVPEERPYSIVALLPEGEFTHEFILDYERDYVLVYLGMDDYPRRRVPRVGIARIINGELHVMEHARVGTSKCREFYFRYGLRHDHHLSLI